jgi:hypothetical protein
VIKEIDIQFADADDASFIYDQQPYTDKYPIQAEQDNLNKMSAVMEGIGVQ